MPQLGHLVKSHRKAKNLSLQALADLVGCTKSYLSMIENQKTDNPPKQHHLINLEKALDLQPGKLTQIASWDKTPDDVKKAFNHVSELASKGQLLAQSIAANVGNQNPISLDELYKSGKLEIHLNPLLAPQSNILAQNTSQPTPLQTKQIPIINKVAAGYPADFTDHDYPAGIADQYINCPDINDPDAFACRVIGDSMLPNYQENDIIVFSPAATITSGCDCFIRIEPDHQATFKRIYFEGEQNQTQKIRLQPLNPKFSAQIYHRQQIAGAYRAVSRIQKI